VLDKLKSNQILIFVNSSARGLALYQALTELGFSVAQIDPDTPKEKRFIFY